MFLLPYYICLYYSYICCKTDVTGVIEALRELHDISELDHLQCDVFPFPLTDDITLSQIPFVNGLYCETKDQLSLYLLFVAKHLNTGSLSDRIIVGSCCSTIACIHSRKINTE